MKVHGTTFLPEAVGEAPTVNFIKKKHVQRAIYTRKRGI
jgi:hypothetical protein